MTTIAIVGAGMMGTALAWPLRDNGVEVRLVGTPLDEEIIRSILYNGLHPTLQRKVPQGVQAFYCEDIAEALHGTEFVVNGVSSFGTDWFVQSVGPRLRPEVPVLAVTKGLVTRPDGYLQTLPEYVNQGLPPALQDRISLNAIGGPCIAHELAARRQTCVVFAGRNLEHLSILKKLFTNSYYHIWTTPDYREVEICAALKNGYALAIGMGVGIMDRAGVDGLAHMYNPQAALFAQSCLEMRLLIKSQDGKEEYVSWLPGAGDLYVTVYGGRTLKLGRLLGQGYSFAEATGQMANVTLESVQIITRVFAAIKPLQDRGKIREEDLPLLSFLHGVISRDQPVDFPFDQFPSISDGYPLSN